MLNIRAPLKFSPPFGINHKEYGVSTNGDQIDIMIHKRLEQDKA